MSGTGQQNSVPTRRLVYTSASAADATTWASGGTMADWVLIEGAGTTVLYDESGLSANAVSIVTDGLAPNKVLTGPWSRFVSTTATRVTMGQGIAPPIPNAQSLATGLAGSLGPCVLAVANLTLSGLQTIDGNVCGAGQRVFAANQTTTTQIGIYVVAAGAWSYAADWASGATIPLGTQIQIQPGGIANFQTYGSMWYVDSATGVVGTGTITAYPARQKGQATLATGSPSTFTVSNLWVKSTTLSSFSVDEITTAANGLKGTLTAGAGTGSLLITGPNTVTDVVAWIVVNG